MQLNYRGVTYDYNPPIVVTPSQPYSDASTGQDAPVAALARALLIEHHGLIQKREQSMLGRVASEVGLGVEAAHYWLPIQGKSWAGVRHTYDRSAVAMS